jgi:hypothetical protein
MEMSSLRVIIQFLSLFLVIVSSIWLFREPGFNTIITFLTSTIALIGSFIVNGAQTNDKSIKTHKSDPYSNPKRLIGDLFTRRTTGRYSSYGYDSSIWSSDPGRIWGGISGAIVGAFIGFFLASPIPIGFFLASPIGFFLVPPGDVKIIFFWAILVAIPGAVSRFFGNIFAILVFIGMFIVVLGLIAVAAMNVDWPG